MNNTVSDTTPSKTQHSTYEQPHLARGKVTKRRARPVAAAFGLTLVGLALSACSSTSTGKATFSTPDGGTSSHASTTPPTTAPTTTPAASAACGGGAVAGQGGILHVFCGGPADAKITMGSVSKELTGGTCVEQAGQYAINFGAVAGPDFPTGQPKPDYFGALIADNDTTQVGITMIINGISSGLIVNRTATLGAGKKTVMLTGKTLSGGQPVTVTVTC